MEVKLRPLTTHWQDAWSLFITHLGNLLFLGLIPQLIVFLLFTVLGGGLIAAATLTDAAAFSTWAGTLVVIVLSILVILVQMFGLFSLVVYILHNKKPLSIKATWAKTWQFFLKYIGLSVIIGAISLGITAVLTVIVTLIAGATGHAIPVIRVETFTGIFLFVLLLASIPGGIFSLYALFAPYFLVDRKLGPWAALKASLRSVHKNVFEVFFRILVLFVPLFLLGIIFSIIPWFGQLLSSVIIPPLVAVYYYELYQDLKKHP